MQASTTFAFIRAECREINDDDEMQITPIVYFRVFRRVSIPYTVFVDDREEQRYVDCYLAFVKETPGQAGMMAALVQRIEAGDDSLNLYGRLGWVPCHLLEGAALPLPFAVQPRER